jgi:hypothetical protein
VFGKRVPGISPKTAIRDGIGGGVLLQRPVGVQRVLQHLAVIARDETDRERLTGELARVVQETLQPDGVTVWLKSAK